MLIDIFFPSKESVFLYSVPKLKKTCNTLPIEYIALIEKPISTPVLESLLICLHQTSFGFSLNKTRPGETAYDTKS